MPAHLEDQVATVFDLIAGVLIAKPAAFLLVEVEGKAQTGVDPTLADLAQSPYCPGLGQGVRDGCQACNVGDGRKAVPLFGKSEARLARLASDVFVTVQYHLGGEWRMPADLDGQMAPVGVEDVERIVVDIGHRLFSFDVVLYVDIPHRRLGSANQDQKQALGDRRLGQIFFGKLVLPLPSETVDYGNVVGFGVPAKATAKPAAQPHQVGVLERLIRSG